MSNEPEGSDRRRIEALENVVRALTSQIGQLRDEVRALRKGAPAPADNALTIPEMAPVKAVSEAEVAAAAARGAQAPVAQPAVPSWESPPAGRKELLPESGGQPAARPSARRKKQESNDFEQLVGRYGTIAVATLAILLGVGAFLQWAIANGLLRPEIRVALGALAAIVLAVLGLRLRSRGATRFGAVLLAIALAVTHLVAWSAGPLLHLVPSTVALSVAALASAALAWLAVREDEQFLFLLGVTGALVAPFITMESSGGSGELLAYGVVVISAAIVALRDPEWMVSAMAIPIFVFWYQGAAVAASGNPPFEDELYWPTAFALGLTAITIAVGAKGLRRVIARGLLVLVAIGILLAGNSPSTPPWTAVIYAFLGLLTVHALRHRSRATGDGEDSVHDLLTLPLVFLGFALIPHDRWGENSGAAIAGAWIAVTLVEGWLDTEQARATHVATALTALFLTVVALTATDETWRVVGLSGVAALSAYALSFFARKQLTGAAILLPIALALGFATAQMVMLYDRRVDFDYAPFVNPVALTALPLVAAWVACAGLASRTLGDERLRDWADENVVAVAKSLGFVAVFLWIRMELAGAFSRDVATFLLITYYAVTGLGTIWYGRQRAVTVARQVGLGLSLYAAAKAVLGANRLSSIGFKVGGLLVVGVFVLVVAYLYRAKPSDDE